MSTYTTSGANFAASSRMTGPSALAPLSSVVVAERRRAEPEDGAMPGAADERRHHLVDLLAVVDFPVGHAVVVASRSVFTIDASFVPMMNTTASGFVARHRLLRVLVPVADAVVGEAARHLVVDGRVDDAGRARGLAERGAERTGERVAADPQPERVVVAERARRLELAVQSEVERWSGRRSCPARGRRATAGGPSSLLRKRRRRCRRPRRATTTHDDDADDADAATTRREPRATACGVGRLLVSHRGVDRS